MNTSTTIKEIAAALVAFNSECPEVVFDKENKFLGNKYATLGAILKTIRQPLAKNGLTVFQGLTSKGLTTRIIHNSGEWIETTAPMIQPGDEKGKSAAQVYGSIITYMRRYMVTAALGIVSDDDNDAQPMQPKKKAFELPKKSEAVLNVRRLVVQAFGKYEAGDKAEVQAELSAIRDSENIADWENHLSKLDPEAFAEYQAKKAGK